MYKIHVCFGLYWLVLIFPLIFMLFGFCVLNQYDHKQGNDKWLIQCARTLVLARRIAKDVFQINRDIHEGFCQKQVFINNSHKKDAVT